MQPKNYKPGEIVACNRNPDATLFVAVSPKPDGFLVQVREYHPTTEYAPQVVDVSMVERATYDQLSGYLRRSQAKPKVAA